LVLGSFLVSPFAVRSANVVSFNINSYRQKRHCQFLITQFMECWIISAEVECRINAFEMWCYRRMNRIKWVDRITNVEVLRRTGTEMSLMKWIKENKKKYIDDTRENDRLFAVASSGVTVGKLSRGRRQGSILSL